MSSQGQSFFFLLPFQPMPTLPCSGQVTPRAVDQASVKSIYLSQSINPLIGPINDSYRLKGLWTPCCGHGFPLDH